VPNQSELVSLVVHRRSMDAGSAACTASVEEARQDEAMETTDMGRGQRGLRMPFASSTRWQKNHAITDSCDVSRL
jgi:hypothetical protein